MRLLIDDKDLKLLLEQNRDKIGHNGIKGIDTLFAGVTFFLSTLAADYSSVKIISSEVMKSICLILGIIFSVWSVIKMIKSSKNKYGHISLYNDIEKLNTITHPFTIVAIKDTFNNYPNRFLLYYDQRWQCKFFFNFKTVDDNEENIKQRLSNILKIEKKDISLVYKTERIYEKYSVSDKIDKIYEHRIYKAEISDFTDILKSNEFTIDGVKYFWMTIQDMENDTQIKEKNLDVVNIIKDTVA